MKEFIPTICSGLRKVNMDTLQIYNLGNKAYYDEVPRYKNPYEYSEEFNDVPFFFNLWNEGWDKASEEHNLFTENQSLKAENKELSIVRAEVMEGNMFLNDDVARLKEQLEVQKLELEGDVQFANETVERFKEDAKNFATAFKISCNKIDKLEDQTVVISTLLDEAFYYSTDSTIFSFRRDTLINYLKNLRSKIDTMRKLFPEKI